MALSVSYSVEENLKHARAIVGDKVLLTPEEVAKIEGVGSVKTIHNASSNCELIGTGRGKNRRYNVNEWEKWHRTRREAKR